MADLLTVSEVARILTAELGVPIRPRTISDIFYRRDLPDELAPVVGGRRLIPHDSLARIRTELERMGVVKDLEP